MISFKLKPENHAALSRWSKRFFLVVFVAGAVLLASKGIAGYRHANSILGDHTVVTAPVELMEVTEERGRKGRTKLMFNFAYSFEANGQAYRGEFTTAESNADPYLGDDVTVQVAYDNADPSRFDRLERLQGMAGFGSLVTRLLVAVLGAALLAGLMHLLLVAKLFVVRQPEPEPAAG
jgi:hypothetical protein